MDRSARPTSGLTVLCVSTSRDSVTELADAVGSRLSNGTVETTTDPTVVPDLLTTRSVDCVVSREEMGAVGGFDLRSTVREQYPQLPVVVWPASAEQSELEARLEEALASRSTAADDGVTTRQPRASPVQELVAADTDCELLTVLNSVVSNHPAVTAATVWLLEPSEQGLKPFEGGESHQLSAPSVAVDAFESGEPQVEEQSSPAAEETSRKWAYPLESVGVVSVTTDGLTPAVRDQFDRLSTVAGACLEHSREYDKLEQRFHHIAERNRQLSQFARTVSHDLNSPLSVIYGRIELSLAEPSNAEMHLQAAKNAAQRVDSLITDHLQTIETAGDDDTESVSVQTVGIQAWRIVDPSMARLRIEPQLGEVEANAIRLQQLFENLIRNAIEHGSEESVGLGSSNTTDPHAVFDEETESVTVTIKPTPDGFAVCDDGPGIPADERSEVFESGYTTTESGSGLGLHIVQEIVASHEWEISVTDSTGGGARFDITTE